MFHIKKECHKTLKGSPQKCFWKAAGFAAHSQRPLSQAVLTTSFRAFIT